MSAYNREYYERNKERIKEKQRVYYEKNKAAAIARAKVNYKAWAKKNPERLAVLKRGYANIRRYGLTQDNYDAMVIAQDGKCGICEQPPKKRGLAVDHAHETGRIRQLLCVNCNALLGHCKDDPKILARAIEYLRSHASRSAA